jgi:putative MFS transporter
VLAVYDRFGITGVVGAISGAYVFIAVLMMVSGIETNRQSLEALEPEKKPEASGAFRQTATRR